MNKQKYETPHIKVLYLEPTTLLLGSKQSPYGNAKENNFDYDDDSWNWDTTPTTTTTESTTTTTGGW